MAGLSGSAATQAWGALNGHPSVRRVCLQIRPQAPLDSEKRGLLGSDPGDATPASERFPRDETKTTTKTQLLPMDILALATMKNAAKCDT